METGTNPKLHEEKAKTWTAGIDFAPAWAPGLSWSSTFYSIEYGNRIFRLPLTVSLDSVLMDPEWSPLVVRNPSRDQIDEACMRRIFFGSVNDCLASTPEVLLDLRVRNLSKTRVNGIDTEFRHSIRTPIGKFGIDLNGNYVLGFEQKLTSDSQGLQLAGVVFNPAKLRMRASLDWSQHGDERPGAGASITADYLDGLRDYEHPPVTHLSSLATFDLQLRYRTAELDSWFGGVDVTLNAVNILNQSPPFLNVDIGYDPSNAKPYGRVISLGLAKHW